eukprot:gnl/TRDRNA2_/TRDRNA2_175677_c2_seq3.p1 gnl/TRDRNA2_/TRDRNA2_175677_c2~~gnl/TRDRNA2_/TRDRNA2_175677_c2_seq3.p1  ORF type:complete len:281 (-),score=86.14 gnl/TRDRNA2_/TRDRNA2_175677_c2_seq3:16-858(-)
MFSRLFTLPKVLTCCGKSDVSKLAEADGEEPLTLAIDDETAAAHRRKILEDQQYWEQKVREDASASKPTREEEAATQRRTKRLSSFQSVKGLVRLEAATRVKKTKEAEELVQEKAKILAAEQPAEVREQGSAEDGSAAVDKPEIATDSDASLVVKVCKFGCGRAVNLDPAKAYVTCCRRCGVCKGSGEHDPDCAGSPAVAAATAEAAKKALEEALQDETAKLEAAAKATARRKKAEQEAESKRQLAEHARKVGGAQDRQRQVEAICTQSSAGYETTKAGA